MTLEQRLAAANQRMQEIAVELESLDTTQEGAEARMDALMAEHAAELEKRNRYQQALGITSSTVVQTTATPSVAQR